MEDPQKHCVACGAGDPACPVTSSGRAWCHDELCAALEGGVAATATASGMAALTTAVMTICSSGDHIVASSQLYGANVNLLKYTLPLFGIHTSFVDPTNHFEVKSAIKEILVTIQLKL